MKYCQGPLCHEYKTKDRIRGTKGSKYYATRRRSNFYYMGGNVCSMQCQADWFRKFGARALDYFGRITEPKRLTPENAWYKDFDYDWQTRTDSNWRMINRLTKEIRPITQEQHEDERFTLNQG